MKKSIILSVAVAAMLGVSATCFAGIGMPKIGGSKAAPKVTKTEESAQPAQTVDLSDITNKQAKVLKYTCGGLYAQAKSLMAVGEALGNADPKLAEASTMLQQGTKSGASKAKTIIAKSQSDMTKSLQQANAKKNDVQVAKLAEAIKTGKAYQQAAIVNYGFVAANAPSALNEATGALKNLGKNPTAASKVNGAISTYKLGIELSGAAQKFASEYDKMVDTMKDQYGVTQEALNAAKSPDVQTVADDCLNAINGK